MFTVKMASQNKDDDFIAFGSLPKKIICEKSDNEGILRRAKAFCTFISATKQRKDNVYSRLGGKLDNLEKEEVFWHSSCYSSYTSQQNIRYVTIQNDKPVDDY